MMRHDRLFGMQHHLFQYLTNDEFVIAAIGVARYPALCVPTASVR